MTLTSAILGGRTGEGTTPGKEEVEPRQERRLRTMQEQLSRATQDAKADDSRDGGGRATQDAKAEFIRSK